ncbi:MAG TPA: M56 family metallopeptidase [Micromonosporaceae bacterium]
MIVPALLFGYLLLAASVAPGRLARARWTRRAPGLAVLAWLTLAASVLLAAMLGFATLAVPPEALGHDLSDLIHECILHLRLDYGAAGGTIAGTVGALGVCAILGRLALTGGARAWHIHQVRRRQRRLLALLGSTTGDGVVIVASNRPAAYCVPGRRGRIVLTDAVLSQLAPDQLAGVLSHERGHLNGRHHLLVGATATLRRAFGFVPAFQLAQEQIADLVELLADDAAAASCRRDRLAAALLALAGGGVPAHTLGAAGASAVSRAHRLATPPRALNAAGALGIGLACATVLLIPPMIAIGPAALAATGDHCRVAQLGHYHR